MSGQLGQVLHYHSRLYQLLGMHSLPLARDAHPIAKLLRLWVVCLAMSFSAVVLMCVTSEDEFLYRGDRFGYFNDGLKYAFAELAILTIYAETAWQRRHLDRFWQLYRRLAPVPAGTVHRQLMQHFRFLVAFYGIMLLEIVIICALRFMQHMSRHVMLFWYTFQPLVFAVHLRNFQFLLHLELMRQQLAQLESELALLVDYSGFASDAASFEGFEEYMQRCVRQKQLVYDRVYKLFTCFTQSFSYSVLTVLLMIYVRVSVDCYFMYYTIYNKIDNVDYYLLLPAILQIPTFIYFSMSCMLMMSRIAYQIHSIVVTASSLSLQIQNFSLQILHQPVHIDCLGMMTLDSYLLTRIAYAVCTYMIFTVQLMPKFSGPYV
ncbi:hypothetical protein KR222_010591 [Zaprionus bogoriensis]|nr:hypothetical protein KR222_010591 [Zaprionus bogoriensis]